MLKKVFYAISRGWTLIRLAEYNRSHQTWTPPLTNATMFQYTQHANTQLHRCSCTCAMEVHDYPGPHCQRCRMSDWTMSRLFIEMSWCTRKMAVGILTCCKASHFNNFWIRSMIHRKPGHFVPITMVTRMTYHSHAVLMY